MSGAPPPGPARIRTLPSAVANQIAAGEVVERPASVVKELLENSVDAGAGSIRIDVEAGGARLVRVRDDGVGIHPDDLTVALERHGTSKLSRADQLERIATLGFRGEALPSIASVSRLVLRSRARGEESGWEVASERSVPVPVAMPPGTVVEVRDLFYNTPARRRFLRAERTELRHVETVIRNVALARFELGLRAHHAAQALLSVGPATSEAESLARLTRILGKQFVEGARALDEAAGGLRLRGWLSDPASAGTVADRQHLFLNGRPIRDPVIRHGLRVAYDDLLHPSQHPAYVLHLEMDTAEVDVNVHPTKSEVRFREARSVHDFVLSAVRRRLVTERADHVVRDDPDALDRVGVEVEAPGRGYRPALAPRGLPPHPGGSTRPSVYGARGGRDAHPPPTAGAIGRVVGLEAQRFLVTEGPDGLLVVDLPGALAASAAQLMGAALAGERLRSQPLLVPPSQAVSDLEADRLEEAGVRLEQLGIVLRRVGPETISLRQLPGCLRRPQPDRVLAAIVAAARAGPVASEALVPALAGVAGALPPAEGPRRLADLQALVQELERSGFRAVPPHAARLDGAALARLLGAAGSARPGRVER